MAEAPPILANVANNPNVSLERPPPPINPHVAPDARNQQPEQYPVGVVVNGANPGATIPLGAPPPYAPFAPAMNPMMGMGMPGFGGTPPWIPPAPERNSGVSPLPGWGVGGYAGQFPPPFAAGGMPWMGGMGGMNGMMGGMPMGMGMGSMGLGMGMGGWGMGMGMPGFHVPPPPFVDGPNGARVPAAQEDPTIKPGGDIPGCTVLQPAENVEIRRFITNVYPWETAGAHLHCERVQADAGWTVGRLITMLRKPNKECQGWAITECIELGGGRFAKGMTYVFGSHQATEQTLSGVGWGQDRNREGGTPLYVYLHRA